MVKFEYKYSLFRSNSQLFLKVLTFLMILKKKKGTHITNND